jgi:hypothetical protein
MKLLDYMEDVGKSLVLLSNTCKAIEKQKLEKDTL